MITKEDLDTNWLALIGNALASADEKWPDVEAMTLTDDDLTRQFYDGFGGSEGVPFTLWTKNRVYFPVVYDGSEWVGSAPRNPCSQKTCHQGGE